MRTLIVAALALLSGCAATQLTLMPRGGGPSGHGAAPRSASNSGPLSVSLGGRTYTGRFVAMPGGAVLATASDRFVSDGPGGTALLSAPDGSTLRCAFSYRAPIGGPVTGIGLCEGSDGKTYDMQIG